MVKRIELNEKTIEGLCEIIINNQEECIFLDVMKNIDDQTITKLSNALKANTSLKNFELIGNDHGTTGDITKILEVLKSHQTITELYLSDFISNDSTILALTRILKDNSKITNFYVSGITLTGSYLEQLSQALSENQGITNLGLNDMIDKDKCDFCEAIADILNSNNRITTLNLYSNYLREVTLLAKALETSQTLKILDLRACDIDDKNVEILAEALLVNKSITSLDLSDNEFGDESTESIAKILGGNHSLMSLALVTYNFKGKQIQPIVDALETNVTLRELTYDFPEATENQVNKISFTLSRNLDYLNKSRFKKMKVPSDSFFPKVGDKRKDEHDNNEEPGQPHECSKNTI